MKCKWCGQAASATFCCTKCLAEYENQYGTTPSQSHFNGCVSGVVWWTAWVMIVGAFLFYDLIIARKLGAVLWTAAFSVTVISYFSVLGKIIGKPAPPPDLE
jgi:hypothetical protein